MFKMLMKKLKERNERILKQEWEAETQRKAAFEAILQKNLTEKMIKETQSLKEQFDQNPDLHVFQLLLPLQVNVDKNNELHMVLKLTQFIGYDFTSDSQAQVQKDLALEYIKNELQKSLKVRIYEQIHFKKAS